MTLGWCFLQLSRDLPSDFGTLLSEWVTYRLLLPSGTTPASAKSENKTAGRGRKGQFKSIRPCPQNSHSKSKGEED